MHRSQPSRQSLHDVPRQDRAQLLDRERDSRGPRRRAARSARARRRAPGCRPSRRSPSPVLPTSFGLGSRCGVTSAAASCVASRRGRGTARPRASNCRRASSATGVVHDHGVRRRAQHAVVERLAQDDVARRAGQVGAALDVARRVAGADAVGRLAGAVGRAHQAHAAGRQDHGHVAVPHQLLRALERHRLHPADAAGRRAGARRRPRP